MPETDVRPGRWSVNDILRNYPTLGVPHFQRGLVWGPDSVSRLLESLYFETPCGVMLLWSPKNPAREGVRLPSGQAPSFLILDGQQRIRSVYQALQGDGESAEGGEVNDDEEKGPKIWCLNLARVPELASEPHLRDAFRDLDRFPLFRLVRDPRDPDAAFKYNLIPLEILLSDSDIPVVLLRGGESTTVLLNRIEEIGLRRMVRGMREHQLFDVHVLQETDRAFRLRDVVDIYNRINSGGRRVESEEVAFATLVSLSPGTGEWLRQAFEKIHPASSRPKPWRSFRDDILQRRKEKAFGFKLILRTFIQVCAYHFGYSLGSNSVSFDVVDRPVFRRDLLRAAEKVKALRDRTSGVLSFVRDVLRSELGCDDLQMLPDTTALLPVFQLLIRFPGIALQPNGDRVVASLILRLLLLPRLNPAIALQLMELVNQSRTGGECLKRLAEEIGEDLTGKALRKRLERSNSLQDRYVLLLYWLVRRKGAHDLTYDQLAPAKRNALVSEYGQKYEHAVLLDESVDPEKQHLVPYKELRKLFGLRSRGRISRHPANNIGNISYLSHAMNDFKTGLGGDAADLSREPEENLKRHLLLGAAGEDLRKVFLEASDGGRKRSQRRKSFERFSRDRRELIGGEFDDWARELGNDSAVRARIEPDDDRLHPQDEDRVRSCGFPDEVEEAFLDCLVTRRLRLSKSKSAKKKGDLVFEIKDDSRRIAIEVKVGPEKGGIGLKLRHSKLASKVLAELEVAPPSILERPPVGADVHKSFWLLSVDEGRCAGTARVLTVLSGLLEKHKTARA